MRPLHIQHARRTPLVRHEERDLIPIRLMHVLMAIAAVVSFAPTAWLMAWAIMELQRFFR